VFDALSERLSTTFASLRGKGRLSEADIDETCLEIRIALLEADVALPVVRSLVAAVKERALGSELSKALNPAQQVITIVDEELVKILGGATRRIRFAKKPPTVIMLAGLQGSGKTTLAGKLAYWLKEQGHTPLLVACDLQRPNAVSQLQIVGTRAGVAVYAPEVGNGVGDPVKVARAGVEEAKRKQHNVVIIDTAGRLGIDAEMMKQAIAIRDATSPDEILYVVDAMVGQDAVTTAAAFADGVGFDGVVLTKLDGDARGGAALSISSVLGRPIFFASSGEKLTEFDAFHPERMAQRILGMGDIATLAEQAQKAMGQDEISAMEAKFNSGVDFDLNDFLTQMQSLKSMGSISKLMGMLPGAANMKAQIANIDENELTRTEAIVQSMTPQERREPKILNGSRRARIAQGSGTKVSEINSLVDRFSKAQKMMRQIQQGKSPGIPGMPTLPGMGNQGAYRPTKAPTAKKSRSGNPAKRAAEASGFTP
jgi:signal recognition particle subunit SRP54